MERDLSSTGKRNHAGLGLATGLGLTTASSVAVALWASVATPLACTAIVIATMSGIGTVAAILSSAGRARARARHHDSKLAELLRTITIRETVADISHGVNQPLAAIVNCADRCLLQMKSGTFDVATLPHVLGQIVTEGLIGGRIVRRLCDAVPVRARRTESVDIGDTARRAIRILEIDARQRGVALRLELRGDRLSIRADALELELAVLAMLEAGIDAVCEARLARAELLVEAVGVESRSEPIDAVRLEAPLLSKPK